MSKDNLSLAEVKSGSDFEVRCTVNSFSQNGKPPKKTQRSKYQDLVIIDLYNDPPLGKLFHYFLYCQMC